MVITNPIITGALYAKGILDKEIYSTSISAHPATLPSSIILMLLIIIMVSPTAGAATTKGPTGMKCNDTRELLLNLLRLDKEINPVKVSVMTD